MTKNKIDGDEGHNQEGLSDKKMCKVHGPKRGMPRAR